MLGVRLSNKHIIVENFIKYNNKQIKPITKSSWLFFLCLIIAIFVVNVNIMAWGALDTGWGNKSTEKKDVEQEEVDPKGKPTKRRTTECIELSTNYLYRRAFSETQLLDVLPKELKDGYSYNCITAGDVDSLSYLKVVLRQQDLDYCLFSTWCMAAEDILQFRQWVEEGRIKKLDAYVGEIFPNSYKIEYKMLKDMYAELNCGRIAVFKNHSKIYAGYGDKFYFGIQTSANINTNPRTENGCITIDKGIFDFYKAYFDGIVSFDK